MLMPYSWVVSKVQAGTRFSLSRKASMYTDGYSMSVKVKMILQFSRFVRVIHELSMNAMFATPPLGSEP